jgi:plasmid stability protein
MKALSIRNLPDDVYEALKTIAATNHRSMQEHVRCLIERETRLVDNQGLANARSWRQRLAGRELGNTVNDVRLDRSR